MRDQVTNAQLFGRFCGQCWKGYVRKIQRFSAWLTQQGVPPHFATFGGWALQAIAIFVLLYVAFWLALVLTLLVLCVSGLTYEDQIQGWHNGPEGYGYYQDGYRIDYGRLLDDD